MRSTDEVGFDLSVLNWKPVTPEQFAGRVDDASVNGIMDEYGNNEIHTKSASKGKGVVTIYYTRKEAGSRVWKPILMTWRTESKWLRFEYIGQRSPEMQKYRCHKIVEAQDLHEKHVQCFFGDGGQMVVAITGTTERYEIPANKIASAENPEDGYLVKYEDGHISWSPREAFENGYAAIPPDAK